MKERYCDHVYIIVSDLTKEITVTIQVSAMADPSVTGLVTTVPAPMRQTVEGKLLVCHYCGQKKQVWGDGQIIDYKADGTPRSK